MRQLGCQDLPLFKHIRTDKKIASGVVNHCNTVVEPAEHVAALSARRWNTSRRSSWSSAPTAAFGREGLSRRIAFYKCVALVEGTNIVRRELGLPEARVRAADPKLWFAGVDAVALPPRAKLGKVSPFAAAEGHDPMTLRFRTRMEINKINPYVLVRANQVARLKSDWRRPMPCAFKSTESPIPRGASI